MQKQVKTNKKTKKVFNINQSESSIVGFTKCSQQKIQKRMYFIRLSVKKFFCISAHTNDECYLSDTCDLHYNFLPRPPEG